METPTYSMTVDTRTPLDETTCSFCGCRLTLKFDTWWDDDGWEADARNGKPWHQHTPVEGSA